MTRGQNVLYVLPHDEAATRQFLAPLVDRLEAGTAETQLLALTADAESAAWIAGAISRLGADAGITAVPATSARRAGRLLRARTPHVVAGTPRELLALVQASALKLEHVRALVVAWTDELLAAGDEPSLESLMAEVPKAGARVIVTGALTPEVEAFVERYARRARRVGAETPAEPAPKSISYVTVSDASRSGALRRLLDDIDPASGFVFVRSDASARAAGEVLRALGYVGDDAAVRLRRAGEGATGEADVSLLYDLPASRAELDEAAAGATRVVALAQPRQLGVLRQLAQGGAVSPLTFPDAAGRARTREAELREELRRALQQGGATRELLAIEPLLDDWDGVEIAAAALRLLEQARSAIPTGAVGATSAMGKLFINIGTKDGARPGDLVGALTSDAGITGAQIGRVELRDTHALVEVDAGVAEEVAQKITGREIRGRRVQARVDRPGERPARERPSREGGERPRRDFGERGPRERPDRAPRDRSASDRPARPRREFSDDRPARPRREYSEDRPRRESSGDRPRSGGFRERPAFDRPRRDADDRPRRPASRPTRPRRSDG